MLSVVIAGVRIYPHAPGHVAAFVLVATFVLWLAHVYAHTVTFSVTHDQHLTRAEVGRVARQEASILEAGVPSFVALLLGAAGVLSEGVSIWLAFGLGVAVLATQGFVFARVERLGPSATAAVVAFNLGFAVLLIWLKLLVGQH